jgi:shikimate dehydrogenase
MDRYAVIGHPVSHSRSPWIHAQFAQQTGQTLRYTTLDAAPGDFVDTVRAFFAGGGRGLNVTVPHKEAACTLAEVLSAAACAAGAVNTLSLDVSGRLCGDNTDGVGLVRDLRVNLGWPLAARRVLLLGAGGAARGVIGPLLAERPSMLCIANRTVARAEALVERLDRPSGLVARGFEALADEAPFDLLINATSAGLEGAVPPLPRSCLASGASCYDMLYGPGTTAFQGWAEAQGARAAQGLGMLVEQAAESFRLWRGVRPDTGPVLARLRALLSPQAGA